MGELNPAKNRDYLQKRIEKLKEDEDFIPENKADLLKFLRFLKVHKQSSDLRRLKYLWILSTCSKLIGIPFRNATKEDIENLVEQVDDNEYWKPSTKKDYRIFIKRFYKWLITDDEEYPKLVKWINTSKKFSLNLEKSQLITKEDIDKVLAVSSNFRDKSFLHVLYESGARIGELTTLQIKNVTFDQYGSIIKVEGKTGIRKIRLVQSASNLSYWIRNHPFKENPESYVWAKNDNPLELMSYNAYTKIIKKHFKIAKVDKKHNPHAFRHAAITRYSAYLSDQQLKVFAGWSKNSDMIGTYSHLTDDDTADAILVMNGIEKKDHTQIKEDTIFCPRCGSPNSPDTDFCFHCNLLLNEALAQKIDDTYSSKLKEVIATNPKARELLSQLAEFL